MPSISDVYVGGNLLNVNRVKTEELVGKKLTIKEVGAQQLRERKRLVVSFSEIDSTLALNKTNATICAEAFGDDYSKWSGKAITLSIAKVNFQGSIRDGMQVNPV